MNDESGQCDAYTLSMLADMIEAVSLRDTGDCSIEAAIQELSDGDMALIEWLCRLVHPETIAALRAQGSSPMWGAGAPDPVDLRAQCTERATP